MLDQMDDQSLKFSTALISVVFRGMVRFFPTAYFSFDNLSNALPGAAKSIGL